MKKFNNFIKIFTILIVAIFLIMVFLPIDSIKLIGENKEGLIEINTNNQMTITYIHSIYHVLQKEIYSIENDVLVLTEMYFEDYQAANYYDPYLIKNMKHNEDGSFVLEKVNKKFSQLKFALGHKTKYYIIINDNIIDLNETFKNTTFLEIKAEKTSFINYIVWRIRNAV